MTQLDGDIGSVFTVMQSWYDPCVLFPKSKAGFGWGQQIHRFPQRMEAGLDRKMLKSQPDFSSTFTPKPGWAQWSTGPSKTPATAAGLAMTLYKELSDVQAGFRKDRGTRGQIANLCRIIKKAREFQKNIYWFIDYAKAFDCVDHSKLWKIFEEMGVSDHLICFLRNMYADK